MKRDTTVPHTSRKIHTLDLVEKSGLEYHFQNKVVAYLGKGDSRLELLVMGGFDPLVVFRTYINGTLCGKQFQWFVIQNYFKSQLLSGRPIFSELTSTYIRYYAEFIEDTMKWAANTSVVPRSVSVDISKMITTLVLPYLTGKYSRQVVQEAMVSLISMKETCADHSRSPYSTSRTKKWYKKISHHLDTVTKGNLVEQYAQRECKRHITSLNNQEKEALFYWAEAVNKGQSAYILATSPRLYNYVRMFIKNNRKKPAPFLSKNITFPPLVPQFTVFFNSYSDRWMIQDGTLMAGAKYRHVCRY